MKLFIIMLVMACFLAPMAVFAGGKQEEPAAMEEEAPMEKEAPKEEPKEKLPPFSVGIFIPGVVAGSPLYEQMVAGAEKVAAEYDNVSIKVLEAGFNQGEWEEKLMSLAATMEYDVILSGNGAMPFVAMPVAEAFPDQKFLIVDSIITDHPQMHTLLYNQVEQAYMVGYLAGLVTKSSMDGATPNLKVGMIAGQEYPAMNQMIIPGYEMGAQAVDPEITVDVRILGNWYDANKAGELVNSMMDAGVDVVMTACGGANQGVIEAAKARGRYVLYFDDDHYALAPGTIIGCAVLDQERAVYEKLVEAMKGTTPWGDAEIVGTSDGYVDFADRTPLYVDAVPDEGVRADMAEMLAGLRTGKVKLDIPKYW